MLKWILHAQVARLWTVFNLRRVGSGIEASERGNLLAGYWKAEPIDCDCLCKISVAWIRAIRYEELAQINLEPRYSTLHTVVFWIMPLCSTLQGYHILGEHTAPSSGLKWAIVPFSPYLAPIDWLYSSWHVSFPRFHFPNMACCSSGGVNCAFSETWVFIYQMVSLRNRQ